MLDPIDLATVSASLSLTSEYTRVAMNRNGVRYMLDCLMILGVNAAMVALKLVG